MKLQLEPVNRAQRRLGLIYGSIGVVLFIAAKLAEIVPLQLPPCPFYMLTGIPCPICGATRAGIYMANLQFGLAFRENPLFALLYLLLLGWVSYSLVGLFAGKLFVIKPTSSGFKPANKLLWVLLILNWIYLVVHAITQEH